MITHIKHINRLEYICKLFHSYCFLALFVIITDDRLNLAVYLGKLLVTNSLIYMFIG